MADSNEVQLLHGHWVDSQGFYHRIVRRPANNQPMDAVPGHCRQADRGELQHPEHGRQANGCEPRQPGHGRPANRGVPQHRDGEECLDIEATDADDTDGDSVDGGSESDTDIASLQDLEEEMLDLEDAGMDDDPQFEELLNLDEVPQILDAAVIDDILLQGPRSPSPEIVERQEPPRPPVAIPVEPVAAHPAPGANFEFLRFPELRQISLQICRDSRTADLVVPPAAVMACVTDLTARVVTCCVTHQGHVFAATHPIGIEGEYVTEFFRVPTVHQTPLLFLWGCVCAELWLMQHPQTRLILHPAQP